MYEKKYIDETSPHSGERNLRRKWPIAFTYLGGVKGAGERKSEATSNSIHSSVT